MPAGISHVAAHGGLLLAAQTTSIPGRRFNAGPHGAYRAHVIVLIREAASDLDAEHTAEALLAQFGAEVVLYRLQGRGLAPTRLTAGWKALARRAGPRCFARCGCVD